MRDKKLYGKYLIVLAGQAITAFGLALMLRSQLGMGSWGAFQQSLGVKIGISFGHTVQLVGAVLVVVAWMLGESPTLVTLMNMVCVGGFSDLFLTRIDPAFGLLAQCGLLAAGVTIYTLGVALYLSVGLGAGPREGVMLGLSRVSGITIRSARILIDFSVLALAWAMGGPIGPGTVAYSLGAGPLIQFFMRPLGCFAGGKDPGKKGEDAHGYASEGGILNRRNRRSSDSEWSSAVK